MKKIVFLVIALFAFMFYVPKATAMNYFDAKQYDLSTEWEQLDVDTAKSWTYFNVIKPTKDGGFIALAGEKQEDAKLYDGTIIKYDKNYQKVWQMSDIVKGVSFNDITELEDGSFVAVGSVGMSYSNAVVVRFDGNGNELYRYVAENYDLGQAFVVKSLSDGGYVIKYSGYQYKLSSGVTSNEKIYFIAYDKDNNIVESFAESQIDKLYNYSFLSSTDVYDLKFTTCSLDDKFWYKRYVGIDIEGDAVFVEGEEIDRVTHVTIYDPDTLTLKSKIDLGSEHSFPVSDIFLSNNAEIYVGGVLYTKDGTVISDAKYSDFHKGYLSGVKGGILANGDFVVGASRLSHIYVKKANKPGVEDYADVIIDGKKITTNLGIFLDSDRTYINVNNLCAAMQCSVSRTQKNDNVLIIRFGLTKSTKYTITHEIGSTNYTAYFDMQPIRIFRLISPTFNSSSVDVTSKKIDGQIYVPLRFIAEALGRYVSYEPNGPNGKPVITISAQNEGEFYDKYSVILSKMEYKDGDIINHPLTDEVYDISCTDDGKMFAYGYEKSTGKIISAEKTAIVPYWTFTDTEHLEYNGSDNSKNITRKSFFTFNDNVIKYDYTAYEVDANSNPTGKMWCNNDEKKEYKFVVVSNIEGYPFTKEITFK